MAEDKNLPCDHDKLIGLEHKVNTIEDKIISLDILKENIIKITALQGQLAENLKQLADNQKRNEDQYGALLAKRDAKDELEMGVTNSLNSKIDLFMAESRHDRQNLTVDVGMLNTSLEQREFKMTKEIEKLAERLNAEVESRRKEKIEIRKARITSVTAIVGAIITAVTAIVLAFI